MESVTMNFGEEKFYLSTDLPYDAQPSSGKIIKTGCIECIINVCD
jgi:hypothetical protein